MRVYPGPRWKPSAVTPVLILPFDTFRTVARTPRPEPIHPASSRSAFKDAHPPRQAAEPPLPARYAAGSRRPVPSVPCASAVAPGGGEGWLPRRPATPQGGRLRRGVRGRGHQPTRDLGVRGRARGSGGQRRPAPPQAPAPPRLPFPRGFSAA